MTSMDKQRDDALAAALYDRRSEAMAVPYEKVSLGDRDPERGECHKNVDARNELHPDDHVVRGWLYENQAMSGTANFHAHSVNRPGFAGGQFV